ncbi:hypothetical protein AAVH_36324 [Aphelenchoides avenae]|nr:hypothetical protein AAVH_36324 [Aphelenchus avenae]
MILDDDSLLEVLQFLSRYHVEHTRLVASIFQRQISLSDHLWPREMFFAEDLVASEPFDDDTTSTDDKDVYDEEQVDFSCTDLIYEIRGMRLRGTPYSRMKRTKRAVFVGKKMVLADHSEFCVQCWPQSCEHVLSLCKGAQPEEITRVISALAIADRYYLRGFHSARFVATFLGSEAALSARFLYLNCSFERADDDDRECEDAILKYVFDQRGSVGRRATFFKVNEATGLVQRLINVRAIPAVLLILKHFRTDKLKHSDQRRAEKADFRE